MAWYNFDGFQIDRNDKNRIETIVVLNAESSKESDFITFAALLRYFLNKNNFDSIVIEFTEFTNKLSKVNDNDPLLIYTKTYQLSLKSVLHDHKRYLEIETLRCCYFGDIEANKKEEINIVKYKDYLNKKVETKDFKPQKKQIPEFRAQIWLEALNKYHL
jgi:hypothetical protein